MRSQRDWTANVTTLSGDIGTPGQQQRQPSYHVIFNNNNEAGQHLANTGWVYYYRWKYRSSSSQSSGSGMYNSSSSPTLTNCFFTGNSAFRGGGMYLLESSPILTNCGFSENSVGGFGAGIYLFESSPTLTNCSFVENSAINFGGGIYSWKSSLALTNCFFTGNSTGTKGGGISCNTTTSIITNCSFSGNSAASEGGGVYNSSSSLNLTNCSFSGNSAANGGGIFNQQGTPTIDNCIFWGNGSEIINANSSFSTANYCIIQGGCPVRTTCTNVLDTDPLFVSQPPIGLGTSGDLHLQECSPAKDAGTAIGAPLTDIDGDARPFGAGIDMGFDENGESCCPAANILYVNQSATGSNNGSTWEHAFTDLQDALNSTCPGITEIWVAAGTYKPTPGIDRTVAFVMKNGVAILGGFPNTGSPGLGERDWTANVTTLSADIDGDNTFANNSYRVIFNNNNGLDGSAVLDGFTITGGNANGLSQYNSGGGMYNRSSSPTVSNCIFSGNSAKISGGGIYNFSASSPIMTNCFSPETRPTLAADVCNVPFPHHDQLLFPPETRRLTALAVECTTMVIRPQ
ncbi:MAG: choice-of-anchor Q domain-containing protein [Saprospiraceae bacterium]